MPRLCVPASADRRSADASVRQRKSLYRFWSWARRSAAAKAFSTPPPVPDAGRALLGDGRGPADIHLDDADMHDVAGFQHHLEGVGDEPVGELGDAARKRIALTMRSGNIEAGKSGGQQSAGGAGSHRPSQMSGTVAKSRFRSPAARLVLDISDQILGKSYCKIFHVDNVIHWLPQDTHACPLSSG